jgi:DNA repair exonuclease SbcCD ATPase subunit
MKVELQEVSIQNFQSIGETPLKMTFDENGKVTIITGYNKDLDSKNGVGKTTILDAVCFLFYGATSRKILKTTIANRYTEGACIVSGKIKIGKAQIEIVRSIRPNSLVYKVDKGDGVVTNEHKTVDETNKDIIDMIGYDKEMFEQEVAMTPNIASNIFSKTPTKKAYFIEQIFNVTNFETYFKEAKDRLKETVASYDKNKTIFENIEGTIQDLKNSHKTFETSRTTYIEQLSKEKTEKEVEVDMMKSSLKEVKQEDLDKINQEVDAIREEYDEKIEAVRQEELININLLERNRSELERDIKDTKTHINTLTATITKAEGLETPIDLIDSDEIAEKERLLKEKKETFKEKLSSLEQKLRGYNSALDTNERAIRDKSRIADMPLDSANCSECGKPLDDEHKEKHVKAVEDAKNEIKAIKAESAKIKEAADKVLESIKTGNEKLGEIDTQLEFLNKQLKNYVANMEVYRLQKEADEARKQLPVQEKELDQLVHAQEANEKVIKTLQDKILALKAECVKIKQKLDEKVQLHSALNEKLKEYQKHVNDIASITKDVVVLEKSIKDKTDEANPYVELIKTNEAKKADANSEMERLFQQKKIDEAVKLVFSPDGVKSMLIKKSVGLFNQHLAFYLRKLGSPFSVVFDEFFDEKITEPLGMEVSYESLSNGERKRVDVAMIFTFRDLRRTFATRSFNFCFFDEIFDSALDAKGVTQILDILKEHASAHQESIYVVTHRQENVDMADTEVMNLIKENNVTTLVA